MTKFFIAVCALFAFSVCAGNNSKAPPEKIKAEDLLLFDNCALHMQHNLDDAQKEVEQKNRQWVEKRNTKYQEYKLQDGDTFDAVTGIITRKPATPDGGAPHDMTLRPPTNTKAPAPPKK